LTTATLRTTTSIMATLLRPDFIGIDTNDFHLHELLAGSLESQHPHCTD
jgi:hypothetical protein